MTMPCIDIVCSSACFAPGGWAETRRAAGGEVLGPAWGRSGPSVFNFELGGLCQRSARNGDTRCKSEDLYRHRNSFRDRGPEGQPRDDHGRIVRGWATPAAGDPRLSLRPALLATTDAVVGSRCRIASATSPGTNTLGGRGS